MPKLGDKKIEQLKKMPLIENRIFKSKDGKYLVNQLKISTIRPVAYFEKIIESEADDDFW